MCLEVFATGIPGRTRSLWFALGALIAVFTTSAPAQDLEPQSYSASPVGLNFVVAGFGRSGGAVLTGPNLQVSDVRATLHNVSLGVGRTFSICGRQALVTAALPYVWGNISGKVFEQSASIRRSGLTDLRVRLSLNLYGNPARTPEEFARRRRRSLIVGTSLTVIAPSGQYDPAKLINLGTNRFAIKPEIGISYPVSKLDLDAYYGIWVYASNVTFFPNRERAQDPVNAIQGHLNYTIRPRLWMAADYTWYSGGRVTIDRVRSPSAVSSSRAGLTLSVPLPQRMSLKFAYSPGLTARTGADFNTLQVVWQLSWLDKKRH